LNILVTNDDGIDSPGIWALANAMKRVGNTLVVAPDKQQSGVGTSFSLHSNIKIIETTPPIQGVRAYAIGGTPSDCVALGLRRLAQEHIDLVISGINLGANVGNDIPYSGTVMATLQGYFRKIPSIAVSLVLHSDEEEPCFDVVSKLAEHLALRVKGDQMPTGAIINANVPNVPLKQIKGIVTTRVASAGYVRLTPAHNGGGFSYSMSTGAGASGHSPHHATEKNPSIVEEGTDISAINAGFISITPLRLDITDHNLIPTLDRHLSVLAHDVLGSALDNSGFQ
jgi:5'-nucleotidase